MNIFNRAENLVNKFKGSPTKQSVARSPLKQRTNWDEALSKELLFEKIHKLKLLNYILFEKIKESYDFFNVIFKPQFKWVSLQNIKLLDFYNYEFELRKVSDNYTNPIIVKNASNGFGKSVVTQKVIDFVRNYYAEDYALAKDRLGKEY